MHILRFLLKLLLPSRIMRSSRCVVKNLLIVSIFGTSIFLCCSTKVKGPWYYQMPAEDMMNSYAVSMVVDIDSVNVELLEWAIFNETNIQRQRLGLLPLKYEFKLQEGARAHSQEMIDLDYFGHTSPVLENETVRKRIVNVGIKHGIGGENIAIHPAQKKQETVFRLSSTAEPSRYAWRNVGIQYTYREFAAHLVNRWLNSAPHRSNILNKRFKFLGVGCVLSRYNGTEVFYVTQNFSTTNY